MTLRKKTLLITGITLLSLFVAIYSTAKTILLGGFAQVEQKDTQQNVTRVIEAYNNELAKLNLMNGDEAEWDDLYAATKTGNFQGRIESSYNYQSLIRSNIDLMLVIRRADRRIRIHGVQYATSRASDRDSIIYFHSRKMGGLAVGRIREIFSHIHAGHLVITSDVWTRMEETFVAISVFEAVPNTVQDPFLKFPEFGGKLYLKRPKQLEVLSICKTAKTRPSKACQQKKDLVSRMNKQK